MSEFIETLREMRRTFGKDEWRNEVREAFRSHPIRPLVHESAFLRRAYEKPRGYAGDAVMLDYIYRIAAPPSDISELGLRIDEWGNQSCSCQGVRDRRDILSDAIDEAAIATKMPRILAVACGHLREVQRSKAVRDRSIGEFYALDQDPESLELVATENAGLGIQPVHGSVRTLLSRKTDFRDLDLIYAAGLYDYLPDPIAARLTSRLFSMMRPGGRLLIANFCPELPDIPFMEACMDWDLIYRNEEQMEGFLSQISSEYRAEVFRDRLGYIAYLDIRKDALRY